MTRYIRKPKIKVPRFKEEQGFYTSEKRSRNMGKIKGKNTKPELLLRKALWARGHRFRVENKQIEGKPDIVFLRKRVAIFVDGEFWHGYRWSEKKQKIRSNRRFWIAKIERNMQRDREVTRELLENGWVVMRFWANEVKKNLDNTVLKIEELLNVTEQKSSNSKSRKR